jgi:hypothetical protein
MITDTALQKRRSILNGRTSGSLLVTLVVLGWSIKYLVTLAVTHTTGPELYGVLVAAVAVGAGLASVALVRSERPQTIATTVVLVLWILVAIAGIAGTVAHIVGPVAGHGPVDLRPRPVTAPLVFTALGSFGGGALARGQHIVARLRSVRFS